MRLWQRGYKAGFQNIVLHCFGVDDNTAEACFLIHVGKASALPPGFLKQYCRESFLRRVIRWSRSVFGRMTMHPLGFSEMSYRYCQIPLIERDPEACLGGNRWRYEDAYSLLRKAGFYLYHSECAANAWTPYDNYCELMKQGRVKLPMNTLIFDRKHLFFYEDTTAP